AGTGACKPAGWSRGGASERDACAALTDWHVPNPDRTARARPPARCEKPGPWGHDRGRVGACRRLAVEAIEPGRGRARIDRERGRSVLEAVSEDVDQAIAALRRRPQRPRVVAIAPQAAGAAGGPVDDARDARGQPLDTARKRGAVGRLDDHVDMVFLDCEVDHSTQ